MIDARVQSKALAKSRGKELIRGMAIGHNGCNVVFVHDSEPGVKEEGIYISQWDEGTLGPWPTEADGFTAKQIKHAPVKK